MHGALFVAKTGLSAQDTSLKLISNNLANVSTVGFKKDRPVFEDLMYQARRQPGAQSGEESTLPSGLQVGSGVRVVGTQKSHTQGDAIITEQTFDMQISGRGYFQIQRPNGEIAYTRNGQFDVNENGELVTNEGYLVQPGITLPADTTEVTIAEDGIVTAIVAGDASAPVNIGQLQTADFVNPVGLRAIGQNLFLETAASGAPIINNPGDGGAGVIRQGMLEGSNVNSVEELVNMITTQRGYEMNSKVISTADEMLSFVTQQL